jgi:hypothetical protein
MQQQNPCTHALCSSSILARTPCAAAVSLHTRLMQQQYPCTPTAGIMRSTILAALAPHRLALAPPTSSPLAALQSLALAGQADGAAAGGAVAGSGAGGYDSELIGLSKSASLQVGRSP